MTTTRLEAFSDGVIAILITIMILELKPPEHAVTWDAIRENELGRKLLAYILSYVFLGIYWSNHHHMLHVTKSVNGKILWANLHLLFWLSLVPLTTAWLGSNASQAIPTAAYGIVLLCAAQAYTTCRTRSSSSRDRTPRSPRRSGAITRASSRACSTSSRLGWRSSTRTSPTRCMRRWRSSGSRQIAESSRRSTTDALP